MNIALIGYGKMGKEIEKIALQRNHTIGLTIDQNNLDEFKKENFSTIQVAIEFTQPESAFENVKKCIELNTPIVSGSTGWHEKLSILEELCKSKNGSMLVSTNFSLGVNIFFAVNTYLSNLMNEIKGYELNIEEIHHTEKKDSPSGTSISLAEQIIKTQKEKTSWVNHTTQNKTEVPIISKRISEVSGIHKITYQNEIDKIEISHEAFNRKGFALGAVLAAEYIALKKGIFSMNQVLGINS